jgi:hypothetical protein
VDYYLFDLQKGYCDYSATAMVVLARAAGLPARLVVGYVTGSYDPSDGTHIITEANAHAWPELYFPGYGWVEFEPTSGLPPIERRADTEPFDWAALERALEPISRTASARQDGPDWVRLLRLRNLIALVVLAGVAWLVSDAWWLRRLRPVATLATLYRRLQRQGRWLAVPMYGGDTPYEFAVSLAGWMADWAQGKWWGSVLTPAIREVRWLVTLYVQVSYSPRRMDAADQVRAIRTWERLRWRLLLARAWQKVFGNVPRRGHETG